MAKNEFKQERLDYAKYHKTIERQLLPYFRKALKENAEPVLVYARLFGTNFNPESIINPNVWQPVYLKVFDIIGMKSARKEYYRQREIEGMEIKATAIDFLRDIWSGRLRDYALQYVFNIQRSLNDRSVAIIQDALNEANEIGLDRDGSVRLFERLLNGKLRLRSLVFARTEATTISNIGKKLGAASWIEEQGGQGYKVWLGRNDNRERQTHLEENNTIIPIDDLHEVGGAFCQHPGDTNLPLDEKVNCRCTESYMSQNRYNQYLKRGRIIDGKLVGAS